MAEILQGKGVVAGIAIGEVVWVANDYEKWFAKYNSDSPKIENEKLEKAIQKVQADLEHNITTMQEKKHGRASANNASSFADFKRSDIY